MLPLHVMLLSLMRLSYFMERIHFWQNRKGTTILPVHMDLSGIIYVNILFLLIQRAYSFHPPSHLSKSAFLLVHLSYAFYLFSI